MTRNKTMVKLVGLAMAATVALLLPGTVAAAGGPPDNRGRGSGQMAPVANGELDAEEQGVLAEFLIDEHKALATYESIMADFGEVQPFASIARAEEQHIAALERVFSRYGVALPEIPAFDIPAFGSLEEAAAAAAQAEIDNAALYDRLMGEIDNPDVLRVADNLRAASLNNHLPAFEAAASGDYVAGEASGTMNQSGRGTGGYASSERGADFRSAVPGTARGRAAGADTRGPAVRGRGMQAEMGDCPAYQQGGFRGR
ncbi:MAG: ferritin-like domain-containing protein [Anaerolineae bacterium]